MLFQNISWVLHEFDNAIIIHIVNGNSNILEAQTEYEYVMERNNVEKSNRLFMCIRKELQRISNSMVSYAHSTPTIILSTLTSS